MSGSTDYAYAWRCGPRWVWKDLHRSPSLALRTFYWAFVRGHVGETCQDCARPYVLWHAPDDLWLRAMGHMGSCLCPECFNKRLIADGLRGGVIFIPEPFFDWNKRMNAQLDADA